MERLELFRAGKLQDAIDACVQQVKEHPTEPAHRDLLSQLLCFAGDLERGPAIVALDELACPLVGCRLEPPALGTVDRNGHPRFPRRHPTTWDGSGLLPPDYVHP